jgi:hypothetical protein
LFVFVPLYVVFRTELIWIPVLLGFELARKEFQVLVHVKYKLETRLDTFLNHAYRHQETTLSTSWPSIL